MSKQYEVYAGNTGRVFIKQDEQGYSLKILDLGATSISNVDLVVIGLKLAAIGMNGPKPSNEVQDKVMEGVEQWAKENGINLEVD